MNFLENIPLKISVLSPVHIGCGEDFEPTNYVIDDKVLYHFNPSNAPLDEKDHKALLGLVTTKPNTDTPSQVQKFFHARKDKFKSFAHTLIPVVDGVATQYDKRIGQTANREQNGKSVNNKLEIERAAYNPHSGDLLIPGSSLKGAMRTAVLNYINKGNLVAHGETDRTVATMQKRLLQGSFETDPFRLLKVGDTCAEQTIQREVIFGVDRKKSSVTDANGKEVLAKGPATRKEVVCAGQYRGFSAQLTLQHITGNLAQHSKVPQIKIDAKSLILACNDFYLARFKEELTMLESRRFVNMEWAKNIRTLLQGELKTAMDAGQAMLLRVGRYTSAEAKTLDGMRNIKIMMGPGKPATYQNAAKTVWLAAKSDSAMSDLLPFGWVLVEIDPKGELPQLKAWLDSLAKQQPNLDAIKQKIRDERETLEAEKQAKAQEKAAAQAKQAEADAEKTRQEEEKLQQRAAMSPQDLSMAETEEFLTNLTPQAKKVGTTEFSSFYSKLTEILKQAIDDPNWTAEQKSTLEKMVKEKTKFITGNKEKDVKALYRQLRGEA